MYRDKITGKEYANRSDYCNSPDIDDDLKYLFLSRGERTPQNETEERWKKEALQIINSGHSFELPFD